MYQTLHQICISELTVLQLFQVYLGKQFVRFVKTRADLFVLSFFQYLFVFCQINYLCKYKPAKTKQLACWYECSAGK